MDSSCIGKRASSGYLSVLVLLLFIFWVPRVSAYALYFTEKSYVVSESHGKLSIGINLDDGGVLHESCQVSGEIRAKEGSTALEGEDYRIINGTFDLHTIGDFPGNDLHGNASRVDRSQRNRASGTIEIEIIQDPFFEDDETIQLEVHLVNTELASNNNNCLSDIALPNTTISIIDDEFNDFGDIHFKKSDHRVSEEEGTVILEVIRRLGNTGSGLVTATLSTVSGTAADGEDYVGITNKEIEFEGDLLIQEVEIDIKPDGVVEEEESFSVSLTSQIDPANPTNTKVTILDSTTPGIVGFASTTFDGEEGGTVEITATREQGTDGELSVDLGIGAEGDTATEGEDYNKPDGSQFNWASGEGGPKTISIPLHADSIAEDDETISLQLLLGEEVLGDAAVTIKDKPPQTGNASFTKSIFSGEEGGSVDVVVTREQGSEGELSVDLGVGAEGDTAVEGEDYNKPEVRQFNWAEGEDGEKKISITLLTDEAIEGEEKISLQLLQGGEVVGNASVILEDKTPHPPGTVSFISNTFSGEEGGSVEIVATREQGSEGKLSVDFGVGLNGDKAVEGEDYDKPDVSQFAWAAGESGTKTISISLLDDKETEGDEQVSLQLLLDKEVLGEAQLVIKDTSVDPDFGAAIDRVEVFGDHQIGDPGSPLPSPFVVKVLDAEENPIKGLNVSWSINPAGGGNLSDGDNTITGDDGQTSNTFTVNIPERVVVTATISQQSNEPKNRNRQARAEGDLTETFIVNGDIVDTEELNQNEVAVATVLDGACSALKDKDSSEAEKDLLATCEELKRNADDPAAVKEGLNLLAPDEVISQGTAVIEASNLQVMNINARLIAVRAGATGFVLSGLNLRIKDQTLPGYVINALVKGKTKGGAAGDVPGIAGRWGGFINGNISFGDKDDSDNETGFEFDSQGITIGADYRLSSQAVIGGAMGITRNKSEFNGSAGQMDMDGAHLTAYGTYYQSQQFYLDGLIKIGSNNYDTRRRVSLLMDPLQQAMGNTDGQEYSLSLSGGYKNNHGALNYGPYGRLSYTKAEIDAYTESASNPGAKGSGSVLSLSDQDVDSLTAVFGGQLSYAISKPSGVYLPQARFEWEHQFSDDSRTLSAQFVHDPNSSVFGISTDDPDRDYFNLGLGVTMVIAGGKSGFVFYETRLDQGNLAQHWIKGGFRLEFR